METHSFGNSTDRKRGLEFLQSAGGLEFAASKIAKKDDLVTSIVSIL